MTSKTDKVYIQVIKEAVVSPEVIMVRHIKTGYVLPYASIPEYEAITNYDILDLNAVIDKYPGLTIETYTLRKHELWIDEHGVAYDVPSWVTDALEDISYHKDECPRFALPDACEVLEDGIPSLWVDHPIPDRRDDSCRFAFTDNTGYPLLETNSESEAQTYLPRWIEKVNQLIKEEKVNDE